MDIFKFITVQVKTTEILQYLHYQVVGKGGVLASHQVNPRKRRVFTFRFWATFAMVPEAFLIVFYYRPNGEIVSDRVELKFDNRLDNYVSRSKEKHNRKGIRLKLIFFSGQY
jgi:Alpha-2-macroglobulin bait region domain